MDLLLHTCCAPCLIYPLEKLKLEGFKVRGFFYNPNIHPSAEYIKRRQTLDVLADDVEIIYPEYSPQQFFRAVNLKKETPQRCWICWKIRLKETARAARKLGCQYFTTTLLVSPYQDQEVLKKIGNDISGEEGVGFYYADFRPGFRKAHDEAKAKGIYCQRYCGCIYSMKPRLSER